jgi:hypothetical protein
MLWTEEYLMLVFHCLERCISDFQAAALSHADLVGMLLVMFRDVSEIPPFSMFNLPQ